MVYKSWDPLGFVDRDEPHDKVASGVGRRHSSVHIRFRL